jgi:hypothetical protein
MLQHHVHFSYCMIDQGDSGLLSDGRKRPFCLCMYYELYGLYGFPVFHPQYGALGVYNLLIDMRSRIPFKDPTKSVPHVPRNKPGAAGAAVLPVLILN